MSTCRRWAAWRQPWCVVCSKPWSRPTPSAPAIVARQDDEVDELYHAIFAETLDLMRADPANVDPGARIIFAAHYLERVGDRVTNIAEDVVFLATGEVTELNQ